MGRGGGRSRQEGRRTGGRDGERGTVADLRRDRSPRLGNGTEGGAIDSAGDR